MNRLTSLLSLIEAEHDACQNIYRLDKQIEKLFANEREVIENPYECEAKERDLENIRRQINDVFSQRSLADSSLRECREHLRQYKDMLEEDK
jgi:hypothetical protein